MITSIAVIGDFQADNQSHIATNCALEHAAAALGTQVKTCWIGTDKLARADISERLKEIHGLWIAPGSPYKNMDAALAAIQFSRVSNLSLLGTCGVFQHIVLEYARNVLGVIDASHAESDPYASVLFISRLACSLVGRTMTISLKPDSLIARAYGKSIAQEGYYCNFGVNPDYVETLRRGRLQIVAS